MLVSDEQIITALAEYVGNSTETLRSLRSTAAVQAWIQDEAYRRILVTKLEGGGHEVNDQFIGAVEDLDDQLVHFMGKREGAKGKPDNGLLRMWATWKALEHLREDMEPVDGD